MNFPWAAQNSKRVKTRTKIIYRYNQEYESFEVFVELQTDQIDRLQDGKGRISLESQISGVEEWQYIW